MGGESSGGSDNSMSNNQLNRAKRNREAKERQASFNQYNKMQQPSPEGGSAQLPSKATMNTVQDNISIAQNLERKAKSSELNIPIPTIGSVAMNTISSMNYNYQAKELRSGGNAVFDKKGEYQGVVGKGTFGGKVYSGNTGYSPLGRSQGVSFNSATGRYTSSQMQTSGNDNSESSNNTPNNTQTTSVNKTDSTTSLSAASRRSLISGGGGGASRRNLI